MGNTFSILISTKNRRDDLLFTLRKISGLTERNDVQCVVFDDGSDDGTFNAVKSNFPKVMLLRNKVPKGYLFCRNKMLDETTADFAISLDDDAHFLSENPIEIIRNHFAGNPKCGLIAFRIFWGKDEPENTVTSETTERVKSFVGCGHAWRMNAWRDISDYPEWFGFYGEENFASLELFRKNWVIHYLPAVLVQHRVDMKARSQSPDFAFRYRRSLRSDWHLYFLFYPVLKIPKKLGYSIWMQLNKIAKGNSRMIVPTFRALLDVIIAVPNYIRFRNGFTSETYKKYMNLKEARIFWKPEADGE
jgi:glycosyltransferase involved in cell wall biosynthesis